MKTFLGTKIKDIVVGCWNGIQCLNETCYNMLIPRQLYTLPKYIIHKTNWNLKKCQKVLIM